MHERTIVMLTAAAFFSIAAGCERTPPADLVVMGVSVWTGDPANPRAEALAARDGRVVAVGDEESVAALVGENTEVLRTDGGLVVPGFIDSHVHVEWGGTGLAGVQLRGAASREELARRLADFAAGLEPGEWIVSGLWDHYNWGGELPRRDWIDAATPDNPVFVIRLDGHMALANGRALELAGIDASTANVEGGEIVRDAEGSPTGIVKDKAMALVQAVIPAPGDTQMDRIVAAAMDHLASRGVTSVHDMGDWRSVAAFRRAYERGNLKTRIYATVPLQDQERLVTELAEVGSGDEWLRIGGVKAFMDGSLGSHTAAFLEPYSDSPEDRGLW
ncbi:MAG: amidohydrolase, partial [Woeseiaceae bacterium]